MKDCNYGRKDDINRRKLSSIFRLFGFMAILTLITAVCGQIGASASVAAPVGKQVDSPIVSKCKADLVKRFKLQAQYIKVINKQAATWPDAALGMPEIGKMYAQMVTPGFRVILEARGSRYLYTTSAKDFKYGGPVSIWSYSMLYSTPVPNEPNLNGDLYQCSLLGTNSVLIFSGATDYYPQEKGVVIVKQRTSRSSHILLYVKAAESMKAKTLYGAFDFGEAAMNSAQNEWAGFVRPTLGAVWNIVVARIGQDSSNALTLPLPDGVRPGRIAWSGEKIMILVPKGDRTVCFETSLKASPSEWKEVGAYTFSGLTSYMLNKSESLEIDQVMENGKPIVEVARVWFTGDRNVIAKISGFTLRNYDLLGSRYAFISGEKGSEPAAYTVDIATGEIIPSFRGASRDIKPFRYPVQHNPLVLGK